MANSLRSFNLLRLKAIIDQRNQAAITFDSANAAASQQTVHEAASTEIEEGTKSSIDGNSLLLHRKTAKGGFYHGQVYLSVKNVVFTPEPLLYEAQPKRPSRYIYDYTDESLEADDEADLEDLLSLSIVDLRPSNISYISQPPREVVAKPTSNPPPLLRSPRKRGQQQNPKKTRRSTLHGSDGLSVRGQNYASWSFGRYVIREIKVQVMAASA